MDVIRHGAAATRAARGGRVDAESVTAGQVALRFTGGPHFGSHVNLTAVRADGEHLWVAGDETATLERLVLDAAAAPTRAGRQRSFRLADLVQLPGTANGEADIEGIARAGGWLWAIGSHALVRRRPKPVHDEEKVVRRLGKLRRDPNRYVIVRLAVQPGVDRRPEPVRVSRDGRRSALVGAPGAENLLDLLRADTHLAPFLAIPARDNGVECQGLAVVGDRLYVGLRGPVLRGWAVVLEVLPVQDPTDPGRLALGIFPEGARYRKHFLELGGLGVRDLCPDGDDLLVLAGPTMALSGPVRVHRWRGAATAGPVVRDAQLPVETVVTHGEGTDHAEGITLLAGETRDPRARLLVVYDMPAAARRPWPDTLLADRVRIGNGGVEQDAEEDVEAAHEDAADGDALDDTTDDAFFDDGTPGDALPDDGIGDDGIRDDELPTQDGESPVEDIRTDAGSVEDVRTDDDPAVELRDAGRPPAGTEEPQPVRPW
jgi:Protein of unknown function (DUF3616)